MLLHELGDGLVLLDESGPEPVELLGAELFLAKRPISGVLEFASGLIEDLLDPVVDLAGLQADLIGEVGDGLLAAEMATDDLSLLLGGEVSTQRVYGTGLRLGRS